MGAGNFVNNSFDADEAMYERQNRLNPPEFAPGQGEDDLFSSDFEQSVGGGSGMGDIFSSGGGGDVFSSGGGDVFSSGGLSGSFNPSSTNPMGGQSNLSSDEEKFYQILEKGGKGVVSFGKEVVSASKGLTPKFISVYGKNVTYTSLVVSALGLVILMLGKHVGMELIKGGILSTAIGILLLMFYVEKGSECSSQYADDNSVQTPMPEPTPAFATGMGGNISFENDFNDFDDEPDVDDIEDFDVDYNINDTDYIDENDFDFSEVKDTQVAGEDINNVLDTLPEVNNGMYTRQFLYDNFIRVLPNLNANFASVKTYDEDSDIFLSWDDIIQRAATVLGLKDDDIPYLKSLEENLFTIKAVISRPAKLKPELLGEEVAKAYAYTEYDNAEDRAKVFSRVETVLDDCIITIFTGASHMVSLKDMYAKCSDFILNNKNYIPVVLGINENGGVVYADFKKIESIIIAGMPRSGKSWLVQAVLTQMCMLLPPDELNIFFLDPKAGTSDFRNFKLPHVKRFASQYTDSNGNTVNKEYESILDVLRWVVNVEAPRRKALIGDHGKVNINDFRASYPDIKLPYIYIVVDEMVTLSEMVKEDEKEYQSYLKMIVTQFPNLGIRGMFIPHEVKNQIIDKTAYDSIKARISVKGSPEHIEASTGTKPKAFAYRLANIGDMAVNIDTISVSTQFVHGVALTDDNDKNVELFDFIRRFWLKYAPNEFSDSVAKSVDGDKVNKELLSSVDLSKSDVPDIVFEPSSAVEDEEYDLFSEPNEDGLSGLNMSADDDFLSDFR